MNFKHIHSANINNLNVETNVYVSGVIYTPSGDSSMWNEAYNTVTGLSNVYVNKSETGALAARAEDANLVIGLSMFL